ncbi:hypothetical protein [Streptomyces hoynatensis]|uniref:ATP-binding protein n=1 Tax=Streptomyces hoynatensis TaxID=1141874 RepID=A0A3A9YUJ3_9ACTN|nr:hypothetical protein [Streptomyces hoynatensis]RKN39194.1 hypothetical protein D7294_21695 [Streptomyces hoynatensis]
MTQLPRPLLASRALRLATVTASAAGAVLAAAGGASAAPHDRPAGPLTGTAGVATGALASSVDPLLDLRLDPLAETPVDPLSNSAGTQVADFRPMSTGELTGPIAEGGSARGLVGGLTPRLLGGLPIG